MFSVILNSYNPTDAHLHMTMACLAAITKFTDDLYEIIVIDNQVEELRNTSVPVLPIRDDYKVLHPYTYVLNENNETVYHCYNQGAKLAKSNKLVFIQSDVYCHERTLNKLVKYLDEWDAAFPQQVPLSRAEVKNLYKVKDGGEADTGGRDAGMIAMTREAFDRVGGWDEDFKILGEKAFFDRWSRNNISWIDRTNALVTHIMAGNNLQKTSKLYNEQMDQDEVVWKERYI